MLLIPALALTYGGYQVANAIDKRQKKLNEAISRVQKMAPVSNRYESTAKTAFIEGSQPTRVIPDVDLRGVPMWHVDYGSGSMTRSYTEPIYIGNNGQYSFP